MFVAAAHNWDTGGVGHTRTEPGVGLVLAGVVQKPLNHRGEPGGEMRRGNMIAVRWCLGLALVVGSCVAVAEAGEATTPASPPGLGQLVIQDAQSGSPVRLNMARYHVHVVLQPPVALVQIDQSFYNPFDQQQEGQFVFNLPLGASVSRFAMYVSPTQLIEGELVERKRASEIYQSIVSRRRDPAILEQLGDNLFKMRVFPIFARDEKRILLDFTLPLEPQAGQYQFRLPLLSDLMPIWDFRVSGAIRGAVQPESAACVSHTELKFQTRADGGVEFRLTKNNYRPETDLVVTFAERADRPASLRSYVAEPLPAQPSAQPSAPGQPAAGSMVAADGHILPGGDPAGWSCRSRRRHRQPMCSYWPTPRRASRIWAQFAGRCARSCRACGRRIGCAWCVWMLRGGPCTRDG